MSRVVVNSYRFVTGGGGTPGSAVSVITTEENDGYWIPSSSYAFSGGVANWLGLNTTRRNAWYRFEGVSIPNAATITSASFGLQSYTNYSGALNHDISAVDADNPGIPGGFGDINNWVLTTATVAWDETSVSGSSVYNMAPDIKTVIQEIVNRVGWVSGNAIIIVIEDDGTSDTYWRPRAANESRPVTLSVDYTI